MGPEYWQTVEEALGIMRKGNAGLIGIADGVSGTGVRNAGHHIRMDCIFTAAAAGTAAAAHIPLCQDPSAPIAHVFYVYPFVAGCGIAVINP